MAVGPFELCVIFFGVILVFGTRKLPDLARNLGRGIREFKKAANNITEKEDNISK